LCILSEIFYQNSDNQPTATFVDSEGFNLLCATSSATPQAIEFKVSSKSRSTELCRKALSTFNGGDDLGLACAAFIRPFSSVRMKLNGCGH
jgi:hypothetical protein